MKPQEALARIIEHREIFHDEMLSLMRQIMSGEVSPVMIAARSCAARKASGEPACCARAGMARQVHSRTNANSRFMRPLSRDETS